jgi:hypothetical protein
MHPQCAVHLSERPEPKAKPPARPGHAARAARASELVEAMAADRSTVVTNAGENAVEAKTPIEPRP